MRELKLRRSTARMIKLNEYLSEFPGANESDKFGETELNEILLNCIPNGYSRQA